MRTARPFVRWAAISAIGIAPAACSIFSGWSDLQGGSKKPGDAATATDDAGDDAGAVPADATLVEREWPYACTPRSCFGKPCCVDLAAPGQASCTASCSSSTLVALYCLDDHDCASSPKGKTCCVFQVNPTSWNQVDCASSCNGQIACDPAAPTACPAGTQCLPGDYDVLYTCQ